MASGKPIVAANTGGIKEIIDDGRNGITVDGREELAEGILNVLKNPGFAESLASNARREADKYRTPKITDRIENLYEKSDRGEILQTSKPSESRSSRPGSDGEI